jgi:thioredoxin reductase (NADPH)
MTLDALFANPMLAYAVPLVLVWTIYVKIRKKHETHSVAKIVASTEAGLLEPASLHPSIDPSKCIGCGSCIRACPEGQILGLINGKAELVEPSHCIGHGACKAACPANAITLVFGTERRGVDIPHVDENFQTNVPGIFIAGELGGMGLVRNAIEQGRQAVDAVRKLRGAATSGVLDLFIVGCGPSGLSASLAALERKLRFVTVEQDSLGGTVAHFPRKKLVMTAPFTLPMAGKFNFKELSKEELVELFEGVAEQAGLEVNFGERVASIVPVQKDFEIKTTGATYRAHSVILTIGRRGTPRTLGVPGENQSKVVYRVIDPEQYRGQHVLVVGGGDSALEAACSIAEVPDTVVTLSHRSESFSRAKIKNRKNVEGLEKAGRLKVLLQSSVKRIDAEKIELEYAGQLHTIENNAVVVSAGGILPTPFLESIGVHVETKRGVA